MLNDLKHLVSELSEDLLARATENAEMMDQSEADENDPILLWFTMRGRT